MDGGVSVGLVLWQKCIVLYQLEWYWGSSGLFCMYWTGTGGRSGLNGISRTGTGIVVDCDIAADWYQPVVYYSV